VRVDLQPAYVLHNRPYRDSSALLEVFTAEHGRISLVARGARRQSRKGSRVALLQPFTPLLLSFSGRSELKNLVATESAQGMLELRAERMFSGLYINELLMRLLHHNDPHPRLFAAYDEVLQGLAGGAVMDSLLRHFEFTLLDELGYSFDLGVDGVSGQQIQETLWYRYDPGCGLVVTADTADHSGNLFSGADLMVMKSGEMDGPVRLTAKRLMREALAEHLGDRPLRSRELFLAANYKGQRKSPKTVTDTGPGRAGLIAVPDGK
jgi:DNA repair protein RecO (recombination protein O)